MEKQSSRRNNREGIEENTLAILDATEAKDTQDANDDRIAFLEAVRAASIVPENGIPPTNKMFEAVFQIMRIGKSLELIMASYQLLNELDKRFPRVYLSKSSSSDPPELAVVDEAWSPFALNLDISSSERESAGKNNSRPLDSSGFHLLIQDLAGVAYETKFQAMDTKSLGNLLMFQYLVNVLEGDFLPRNTVYKETMNWTLLRESLLNMLMGSRRISYKGLMKDCLSIMCGLSQLHTRIGYDLGYPGKSMARSSDSCDTDVAIALVEVGKSTCISIKKLLTLIMELDVSKKNADMEGHTTRADGVRTPLVEIILDELTYDKDILSPFLQVFDEPKWKLEIILQYISKYTAKPSVRTRRSNGSTDDSTFSAALKRFSNSTSIRNVTKKINTEVLQLLLAHAFQAHLSLSSQHVEGVFSSKEEVRGSSLLEICKNILSAFNSLRNTDENMVILPFVKEAMFTAATILSTKS